MFAQKEPGLVVPGVEQGLSQLPGIYLPGEAAKVGVDRAGRGGGVVVFVRVGRVGSGGGDGRGGGGVEGMGGSASLESSTREKRPPFACDKIIAMRDAGE